MRRLLASPEMLAARVAAVVDATEEVAERARPEIADARRLVGWNRIVELVDEHTVGHEGED